MFSTDKEAIDYLGLTVNEKYRLKLRTGTSQPLTDAIGLANFIQSLELGGHQFIKTSNVNLSWQIFYMSYQAILSVGPKLVGPAQLPDHLASEAGFLDPYKYAKIHSVCQTVRPLGIPCPEWLRVGYHDQLNRSWGIQRVVEGDNLGDIWGDLKRDEQLQIITDLAKLLAQLHTVTASKHQVDDFRFRNWFLNRVAGAVEWLKDQNQLIDNMDQLIIEQTKYLLDRVTPTPLACVHGDILFHNVFVEKRNSRWLITGLIDWETVAQPAAPVYDALLGAWWMAGEAEEDNDPELFSCFSARYNQAMQVEIIPHDPQQLDHLLKLVDLTWYLQVLPFTKLFESHRYDHRFEAVNLILGKIQNSRPYLPDDFRIK